MKFSILIPAFKSSFLREAISSCLSQTFQDFEVVVVNDASPEDLDSIVKGFTDNRIKYYINEKGCGAENVVNNWNKCLNYSSGQYVICMGDDDLLMSNCLEEYNKTINKYPGLGVYHAWTIIIDDNGHPIRMQHARPEWEGPASLAWHRWNGRSSQYIGDFCYDAALLKAKGGFYKLPLAWGTDDITAVRAALRSGIASTSVPCFMYRENNQNITRTSSYRIKAKAAYMEQRWYMDTISCLGENFTVPSSMKQDEDALVSVESYFKKMLHAELTLHFYRKLSSLILHDFRQKPTSLFYWLAHCQEIGITKKQTIKIWCKSIFSY